jgi:uncharacterized repeat protein (TIGR01451 family)
MIIPELILQINKSLLRVLPQLFVLGIILCIAIIFNASDCLAEINAADFQTEIEVGTGNNSKMWHPATPTLIAPEMSAVPGSTAPSFSLRYSAEPTSIEMPGPITYQAVVKNTGSVPLTGIRISGTLLASFSGPGGDGGQPGILDIGEAWIFTGDYEVFQKVIDGNGVNEANAINGDGGIESSITVAFNETVSPQSAVASVDVIQNPTFIVSTEADIPSLDAPGILTYKITIENTGNVSLTKFTISDPPLDTLPKPEEDQPDKNPQGDIKNPGILDVDEIWTYTVRYPVTQEVIDGNGVDENNTIDGDGNINSIVSISFAETEPQSTGTAVKIIQKPQYTIKKEADTTSIDEPETINYEIIIENTGNVSLTRISIADPLLDDLNGPEGDESNPEVLDVNKTWIYTGSYKATQAVIDGNGVDADNVIDGDGDIDSTVIVSFAEIDTPQTAYTAVATNLSITGDIFEKKHRYIHGFLSANQTYTTNLYKTDRDPNDCWTTIITPGIWATYPSNMKRSVEIVTQNASPGGLAIEPFNPSFFKRFQAYFLYSPQLEMYHGQNGKAYQDPDLDGGIIDNNNVNTAGDGVREFTDDQGSVDRLTHRFDGMLHYHSGNRMSVRAIDQYKISYDAFSERAYLTDDKYKSNMFNLAGTFDLTKKFQLRLDYSNFYLNYEDDFNKDADRKDNIYAAYVFFRMTSKTSVFLEYDFADIGYDSSTKDSHEHRYFAGLQWEMSGKSSGQIKGGFGRKKSDNSPIIDTDVAVSDISENNWMAAIQLDHNLTSKTNVTFNAYRRYDEVLEHRYNYGIFDDFYADYTLAHFAGLKFSWNVISNLHLNLDTSLFYDEFINSQGIDREGIQTNREDWEFAVSPSVTIALWDHFSINGAYIYTDHDSNYNGHDYIDHTFFARASMFF